MKDGSCPKCNERAEKQQKMQNAKEGDAIEETEKFVVMKLHSERSDKNFVPPETSDSEEEQTAKDDGVNKEASSLVVNMINPDPSKVTSVKAETTDSKQVSTELEDQPNKEE